MTEIYTGYFFIALAFAFAIVVSIAWVLDQNLETGYRPSKDSARAKRDVEKLLRGANK